MLMKLLLWFGVPAVKEGEEQEDIQWIQNLKSLYEEMESALLPSQFQVSEHLYHSDHTAAET